MMLSGTKSIARTVADRGEVDRDGRDHDGGVKVTSTATGGHSDTSVAVD